MKKNLRYEIVPQMKVYDQIGYKWLPFIMFTQSPNFRSKIVNTDDKGFRFNSKNQINDKTIFNLEEKDKNILIIGGSFVFGAGSTSDENTISGYLSNSDVNCLNLGGNAHIGFQELISIFSNINHIKNLKKIIIVSGINDFYLSNQFNINYPDLFYFNSDFILNMNRMRISNRKKILKFLINIIYPNVLNDENIANLNKDNLIQFLTSTNFRQTFKEQKFLHLTLEEKLERNFKIYQILGTHFNCEVNFCLQPALIWSKQMCKEEELLFNHSNIYLKNRRGYSKTLFTKENYEYFTKLLKNLSKKYDVKYLDINAYFNNCLVKDDWVFVDSVHCNDKGYKLVSEIFK